MLDLPLGPVIGPLVMCGYLINEKNIRKLKKLGVKDSKLLTRKKREELAPKLKKLCDNFIIITVPAKEIDSLRSVSNMNKMEIERMREIIGIVSPEKVIIDAIEADTKKFHSKISRGFDCEIITENFADKTYPVVSAASVLAKIHRDSEVKKIENKIGFFGSGYPSDSRTISFLKDHIKRNKEISHYIRKSWITVKLIKGEIGQSKIMDFG